MKPYATEVEFLRDEVEKCHASMHSQIETLKVLMEAHLELKKKVDRPWASLTDEEVQNIMEKTVAKSSELDDISGDTARLFVKNIEAKLKEKNGG